MDGPPSPWVMGNLEVISVVAKRWLIVVAAALNNKCSTT